MNLSASTAPVSADPAPASSPALISDHVPRTRGAWPTFWLTSALLTHVFFFLATIACLRSTYEMGTWLAIAALTGSTVAMIGAAVLLRQAAMSLRLLLMTAASATVAALGRELLLCREFEDVIQSRLKLWGGRSDSILLADTESMTWGLGLVFADCLAVALASRLMTAAVARTGGTLKLKRSGWLIVTAGGLLAISAVSRFSGGLSGLMTGGSGTSAVVISAIGLLMLFVCFFGPTKVRWGTLLAFVVIVVVQIAVAGAGISLVPDRSNSMQFDCQLAPTAFGVGFLVCGLLLRVAQGSLPLARTCELRPCAIALAGAGLLFFTGTLALNRWELGHLLAGDGATVASSVARSRARGVKLTYDRRRGAVEMRRAAWAAQDALRQSFDGIVPWATGFQLSLFGVQPADDLGFLRPIPGNLITPVPSLSIQCSRITPEQLELVGSGRMLSLWDTEVATSFPKYSAVIHGQLFPSHDWRQMADVLESIDAENSTGLIRLDLQGYGSPEGLTEEDAAARSRVINQLVQRTWGPGVGLSLTTHGLSPADAERLFGENRNADRFEITARGPVHEFRQSLCRFVLAGGGRLTFWGEETVERESDWMFALALAAPEQVTLRLAWWRNVELAEGTGRLEWMAGAGCFLPGDESTDGRATLIAPQDAWIEALPLAEAASIRSLLTGTGFMDTGGGGPVDLTLAAGLPNLEKLSCGKAVLLDAAQLAGLSGLRELQLGPMDSTNWNRLASVAGVLLPKLETLTLDGHPDPAAIPVLRGLPVLKKLVVLPVDKTTVEAALAQLRAQLPGVEIELGEQASDWVPETLRVHRERLRERLLEGQ